MRFVSGVLLSWTSFLFLALVGGCSQSSQPAQPSPEAAANAGSNRSEDVGASDVPAVDAESSSQKTKEPVSGSGDAETPQKPKGTATEHTAQPESENSVPESVSATEEPSDTGAAGVSVEAVLSASEAEGHIRTAVALGLINKGSALEESALKMTEDVRQGKFPADVALFAAAGFREGQIDATTRAAIESYSRAATDKERGSVAFKIQAGQCRFYLAVAAALGVVKEETPVYDGARRLVADVETGKFPADVAVVVMRLLRETGAATIIRALEAYGQAKTDQEKQEATKEIRAAAK